MITLIVIVLFLGIKVDIAYNYTSNKMTLNIVVLKKIYVLSIVLLIVNGKFYYYINNGIPRPLTIPRDKEIPKIKFPKIKLYNASIGMTLSMQNVSTMSIVAGVLNILFAYIEHNGYVKISDFRHDLVMDIGLFDVKFIVDFTIKFSLIKIIFSILHTMIRRKGSRRQYATQSNRRTNGMYTRQDARHNRYQQHSGGPY